eukprot:1160951-Pelagomonas_calceolata.AAC.6
MFGWAEVGLGCVKTRAWALAICLFQGRVPPAELFGYNCKEALVRIVRRLEGDRVYEDCSIFVDKT